MNVSYYDPQVAQAATAAVGIGIANDPSIRTVFHDGTACDWHPVTNTCRVPRFAMASGLTETELKLGRAKVFHEHGHAAKSKVPRHLWPKGALFEVWNAIEDRWMERAYSEEWPGVREAFDFAARHYNKDIGRRVMAGEIDAPLWEALVAMGFQSEGLSVAWTLTPKARAYFDAAYSTFVEWRHSRNSMDNIELAKRVLALLQDANDQWKQDHQQPQPPQDSDEQEQGDEGQQGGPGGQGEGGEEEQDDNEPQGGGRGKDLDDYENEDKKGGAGEAGDDSDEDGDEDGNAKSDDEGDDEGDAGSKGDDESGEDGSEGDEGDEAGSKGEEGDESGSEGSESASEGSEGDSAGSDSEGDDDADESDDNAPGKCERKPDQNEDGRELKDEDFDMEDIEHVDSSLEDDLAGAPSMDELAQEALDKAFERLQQDADEQPDNYGPYTARTDLDEHIVPEGDAALFAKLRAEVGPSVFAITRTLEQALRAMAKTRTLRGRRSGSLDMGRLTHIAKNLSKNVFTKKRDGSSLNTAVVITIDESGSMSGEDAEVQKVVTALGEAMNACGIPFEVVGGTTRFDCYAPNIKDRNGFSRTNPIVYRHYKMFGEQWATARSRIVRSVARSHYIDGELVEYAAARLAQRPETRKVIISISDGDPMGGQGNDRELGANLKRVVKRTREAGIEVYSLAINTNDPARFYGAEYCIRLDNGTDFGSKFAKTFVDIVTKGAVKVGQ
jgi:cobalamin biosynthesis protein CobT